MRRDACFNTHMENTKVLTVVNYGQSTIVQWVVYQLFPVFRVRIQGCVLEGVDLCWPIFRTHVRSQRGGEGGAKCSVHSRHIPSITSLYKLYNFYTNPFIFIYIPFKGPYIALYKVKSINHDVFQHMLKRLINPRVLSEFSCRQSRLDRVPGWTNIAKCNNKRL